MSERVLVKGNEALAEAAIRAAIRFSDIPVQAPPLWYAIITKDGVVRC